MDGRLHVVPVNAFDASFVDRLTLCLEERFLLSGRVERSLAVPATALNTSRKQLFTNSLLNRLLRAHPEHDGMLLALTEFDLYKTSQRFVFGDADEQQGATVISLHRLRPEFYGEPPDTNVLFQRTLKEAVHEIGHALGLRHCYNARCAMYYSHSVFETDNKMSHFCEACDKRVNRARRSFP